MLKSERAGAYVNFMWEQTKSIIGFERNWEAVQAVAESLLGQKTISSRKVRQLVREAIGLHHIPKVNLV